MNRRVPCDDETLLLLLHGELPLVATLRMRLHLWTCPACRAKAQQLSQLSVGLAAHLHQTGHSPRFRQTSRFFPSPLWIITGLLALTFGSVGMVVWQWRAANPTYSPATASLASEGSEECLPPAQPTPCPKH
jgi:anti-sigma factor RsiW